MRVALAATLLLGSLALSSCAMTLPTINWGGDAEVSTSAATETETAPLIKEEEAEYTAYNLSDVMLLQEPINTTCFDGGCGSARHIQFDLKISPSVADGFKKAGFTLTFGLVSAKSSDVISGVTDLAVSVSDDGKITYIGGASSCTLSTIQWGNGKVAWSSGGQNGTFCGSTLLDVLPDEGDTLRQVVIFGPTENPEWICRGFVVAYKQGSAPVLMYTNAVTHQYQKTGILV